MTTDYFQRCSTMFRLRPTMFDGIPTTFDDVKQYIPLWTLFQLCSTMSRHFPQCLPTYFRALSGIVGHCRALLGVFGHCRALLYRASSTTPYFKYFLHCRIVSLQKSIKKIPKATLSLFLQSLPSTQ